MNKGSLIAFAGALWFVLAILYSLFFPTPVRSEQPDIHTAVAFY